MPSDPLKCPARGLKPAGVWTQFSSACEWIKNVCSPPSPWWSWRWCAAATATGGCCGTAGRRWRPTPRRGSPGRWACAGCWSGPGSGWSWASPLPPSAPPDPRWRSPEHLWSLSWLRSRDRRWGRTEKSSSFKTNVSLWHIWKVDQQNSKRLLQVCVVSPAAVDIRWFDSTLKTNKMFFLANFTA